MRTLVALLAAGLVLIACEALADTATPTITLYLPSSGPSSTTLTGTVTIRVTGTNLSDLTEYEVLLDGNRLTYGYFSYPYGSRESSWDTRTVANGAHTLLAQLKSSSGTVISSTTMGVTVDQDLIAPTVSVLAPANGATVHETVSVQGTASDDRGVYVVRALVDGVVIDADFGAPYSFDSLYVKHLPNGPHTLTLEAWDFSQNVTVSEPITLFLDNDNTAPNVVLTAPVSGTVVPGGPVSLTADASDDRGISRVVFLVNGSPIEEDTTAPYGVEWNSDIAFSGDYILTAKAYDRVGNVAESAPVSLTVFKPGTAVFDPVLHAPVCDTVGSFCDTARLVEGRNTSEMHAPNTIDGCLDAAGLDQGYSQRVQRITVTRVGGEFLAANRRARIDVLVYGDTITPDELDLYSASDATHPSWTYLTTVPATVYGAQWLSAEVVLPAGTLQAVRAQFRGSANSSASPCSVGVVDDHDDLVFAVGPPTDAFPPTVELTTPYGTPPDGYGLVGGQVRVAASAEDDMAVVGVEFYADGTLIGTDTSEPYEMFWNSAAVADGFHSLIAKAYDPAGRSTTSKAVVVTTDNTGPSATLSSLAQGALLRGNVVLDCTASDPHNVTRVDYYSSEALLNAYPVSPQTSYAATWFTWSVPDGVHRLTARARDSLGNVGISTEVVVTIDNTPPSAEFTAPQAYTALRGIIPVSATATDANGVARVEFYAGGQLIGTDTSAPYTVNWDSRTGLDGSVSLTMRAYDTAGNVQVSSSLPVSVDNSAPTVAITSPANGASLFLSTTLQASAADNAGVTQVVFYDGATVIGTDTTAPYSMSWSLLFVSKGTHTLTAKAFDAVGNVTTSVPVTVKVN
ncbi:Ig-like domain-containing protein [Hyalangium versicolor]|uniref:Ig-like domain-containing protein n=1 Tax=Hyalangium versicolor TaxID=2861190 RepID=UPI001CCE713F|nr:Ig-like domain-containing protein [Hyalangium versicolor]